MRAKTLDYCLALIPRAKAYALSNRKFSFSFNSTMMFTEEDAWLEGRLEVAKTVFMFLLNNSVCMEIYNADFRLTSFEGQAKKAMEFLIPLEKNGCYQVDLMKAKFEGFELFWADWGVYYLEGSSGMKLAYLPSNLDLSPLYEVGVTFLTMKPDIPAKAKVRRTVDSRNLVAVVTALGVTDVILPKSQEIILERVKENLCNNIVLCGREEFASKNELRQLVEQYF